MSESRLKRISEIAALKRPNFFTGKLLTPEDFELEQQYFREKLKRHNRSLHGFGIVSGLKVTARSGEIFVEPGLALDCEGNELVIGTPQSIVSPASSCEWRAAYVNLRYVEKSTDQTIGRSEEFSTITEGFELTLAQENCNRGHRHLRARWLACGQPHAVTIAKLKRNAQSWRVERGYRPPRIK
jgi:hypothetical protein